MNAKKASIVAFWVLMVIVAIQWIILTFRGVSGIGFFSFLEYAQLISFTPLLTARYNPELYEIFKTFLWSNLIFNRKLTYFNPNSSYQSENAKFYGLSNWQIIESNIIWGALFVIILIVNLVVHLIYKKQAAEQLLLWRRNPLNKGLNLRHSDILSENPTRIDKLRRQFRFNIYIRFMMFAYFDLLILTMLGVFYNSESATKKSWISFTRLFSVIGLSALIILPIVAVVALLWRFQFFLDKHSKKTLGTLLLKIDKGHKFRVIQPAFFFIRRIVTAYLIILSM